MTAVCLEIYRSCLWQKKWFCDFFWQKLSFNELSYGNSRNSNKSSSSSALLSVIFENLFQTQHGTPGGHICSVVIISVDRRKIEKCAKIVVAAVKTIVEKKNLK